MTSDQRPPGRSRWAATASVIAAAVVAAVVLTVVLLSRPTPTAQDPSPSAMSGVPSASASPNDSAEPTQSEGASPAPTEGYTTVILGDEGTAVLATIGPTGAVALGYDASGAIAWFSPDGRDWQPAQVPAGMQDVRPMAVAASELGYVAAMAHCLQECFGGELWYSADGTSWADTPMSITGGVLVHLAAGGPGFVAMAIEPYAAGSPNVTPTVLISEDGQTWVAGQPAGLRGANVHAVAATNDAVVAIGNLGAEVGTLDASWTTSDGQTWERHEEDSDRASVFDLAWNGTDLLATGHGSCPDGNGMGDQCLGEGNLAWRSSDGRSWEPALRDPCCGGLSSVVATPTGWVALLIPGQDPAGSPHALAGTLDQAEWRAVAVEADGELLVQSVAAHDGLVLFVGELRVADVPSPVIVISNEPLP